MECPAPALTDKALMRDDADLYWMLILVENVEILQSSVQ